MKKFTVAAIAMSALVVSVSADAAVYRLNLNGTVGALYTQTYNNPGATGLSSYLLGFRPGDPISLSFNYDPTGLRGNADRWPSNLIYGYAPVTEITSSFNYGAVDPVRYSAIGEIGIGLEPRGGGGEGDSFDFDKFSISVDGGWNQETRFEVGFGGYDPTGKALTTNAFDQVFPLDRFPSLGATLRLYDGSGWISFGFDNLQATVAAVPEPSTWGMMIVGFGAIGCSYRRRKARVSFA